MRNPFRKHSISILNKSWHPIATKVHSLKFIPRQGELIFLEEFNQYFKVLNVIYYLNKKQGIFIIVDEFEDKQNSKNRTEIQSPQQ
jgi:hypothetical protein